MEEVRDLKRAHDTAPDALPISPQGVIRRVGALAPEGSVVTTDVGQHQMWVAQHYPFERAGQLLTSGGLGTMGFGLPAAIGAAFANPSATVLCFSGDGSIMMNIQELATLAEHGLNVKVMVLNNGALGLVRQQQELFYGGRTMASQYRHNPDLVTIARGFGIAARHVAMEACGEAEILDFLSGEGPALMNVTIPQSANVFPMVPPGAANTQMIEGETHA